MVFLDFLNPRKVVLDLGGPLLLIVLLIMTVWLSAAARRFRPILGMTKRRRSSRYGPEGSS